jgi:hypothetical protein
MLKKYTLIKILVVALGLVTTLGEAFGDHC